MREHGRTALWWRKCASCAMERRLATLEPERMISHNRWDADRRAMVRCEGSGRPPAAPASSRAVIGEAS